MYSHKPARVNRRETISDLENFTARKDDYLDEESPLLAMKGIIRARAAMKPISVGHEMIQEAASASQIFELQCSGGHYSFLPVDSGARNMPLTDGAFLFVVLANDPGRIYCGVPYGSSAAHPDFSISGHTSLTYRADALYAGEIFFSHGTLLSWNNGSGHYKPAAALRDVNLIPAVRRLLPDDRFIDYWSMSMQQAREQLTMRGYTVME
ncbi:hypothetical protein [Pseudomonas sp. NPDC086251]|uniref:hypothetical protein n=1 Tax=Pseudomonas sp. NPDC086251 TaxID=3364431 RepID=UPI0038341224